MSRVRAEPAPTDDYDHPLDLELHTALADLVESDREVLRLWAWEQLEPAEIASVLGITPNSASIRLHRAKKRLLKNLDATRKNELTSGHSRVERQEEDRS